MRGFAPAGPWIAHAWRMHLCRGRPMFYEILLLDRVVTMHCGSWLEHSWTADGIGTRDGYTENLSWALVPPLSCKVPPVPRHGF